MTKKIKLLLLALGLGLLTVVPLVNAEECTPCNDANGNGVCDEDEQPPADSMPERMIVDDMPSEAFADIEL